MMRLKSFHRLRVAVTRLSGVLKMLLILIAAMCQLSGSQAAAQSVVSEASDPPIALAKYAKQTIEAKELALANTEAEIFKAIDTAITGLRLDTLSNSQAALAGFAAAAQRLNQLAEQLLEHHKRYDRDLDALQSALVGAPAIFREAGKAFRRYAEEETYAELKQDYVTVAETWEQIASVVEARARSFSTQEQEIMEAVRYVERTSVFLNRLQQHLEALPDVASLGARERYLNQLKEYARAFEQMRSLFRKFHDEMMKQAVNPSLRRQAMLASHEKSEPTQQPAPAPQLKRPVAIFAHNGDEATIVRSASLDWLRNESYAYYRDGKAVGRLIPWAPNDRRIELRRQSGLPMQTGDVIDVEEPDPLYLRLRNSQYVGMYR